MKMKGSITNANSRASQMADILQQARLTLLKENSGMELSSDDTRRIILLCVLFIVAYDNRISESYQLSDILESLSVLSLFKRWFKTERINTGIQLTNTINQLSGICHFENWNDLLDYSCESLEYDVDTYLSLTVRRGVRANNIIKKDQGIFYTPEDTVLFMVGKCLNMLSKKKSLNSCTYLDCSCGTAIFLKSLFLQLDERCNVSHSLCESLEILNHCIWGIDKSEKAIDNSVFVFLKLFITKYVDHQHEMDKIINTVLNSFIVGDATDLDRVLSCSSVFPMRFDCIIGNPPYVTINRNTNLFIRFVEVMMNYSSDISCSALVLPLSICYSQGTGFIALRKQIMRDNARWEFHNYDRSPDSLFGDQVKTRNTILFRTTIDATKQCLATKLQRWTSETRHALFLNNNLCDITGIDIQNRVPKLSQNYEIEPYLSFSSSGACLADLCARSRTDDFVVMNGTAYNWICAYDHFPPSKDENDQLYRSSTCSIHYFPDSESKYFCLAMLSNRFAYWYWTVIGDGFHLNSTFLSEFRIDKTLLNEEHYSKLCCLGKEYCASIKQYPTVSYNSGKMLVNYSHWESMHLVERIEQIIQSALSLSDEFCSGINRWYHQQVTCNR